MQKDSWRSQPLSVEETVKNISKYDAVWCGQLITEHNPNAWRYLRKNNPEQLMLYYISGNTVQVNGGFTCLEYDYINKYHPEWFLVKDTKTPGKLDPRSLDNRIRWNPTNKNHTYYNRFFIDVGNKEFQRWAAEQIVQRVSGKKDNLAFGYDGLAMDNVGLVALEKDLTRKYPDWKYARRPGKWVEAYFEYIEKVHKELNAKNLILVVNHTSSHSWDTDESYWQKLISITDGLMSELPLGGSGGYVTGGREWLTAIKRHEQIIENGLIDWWVCTPPETGPRAYEDLLYTYCSWLLVKKDRQSFYFATKGTKAYKNPIVSWYEEYELPLGEPASERYLKNDCWVRDYVNAKIIVNSTNSFRKIVLGANRYWYDHTNERAVKELGLSPRTARIVSRTSYSQDDYTLNNNGVPVNK